MIYVTKYSCMMYDGRDKYISNTYVLKYLIDEKERNINNYNY